MKPLAALLTALLVLTAPGAAVATPGPTDAQDVTRLVHAVATEDEQDEVAIVEVDDGFYQQESPASLHADPPRHLPVLEVLPRASAPTTADDLIAALAGEPPARRGVRERIRSWRGR